MASDLEEVPTDREILDPVMRGMRIEPEREDEDLRMYDLMQAVKSSEDPQFREVTKFVLGAYRDRRAAEGEPAFKYLDQARNKEFTRQLHTQLPFFEKLFSGPQNFASAYPVEQQPGIEERFSNSYKPEDDKRQTANMVFYQAMTGQEPDSDAWAQQRTDYAKSALGWQGDVIDDAALYGLIGKKVTEQIHEKDMGETIAKKVQGEILAGRGYLEAVAESKTLTGDWDRYEPIAKQSAAAVLSEYSDREMQLAGLGFEELEKVQGTEAADLYRGDAGEFFKAYADSDQRGRDKLMGGIGWLAESKSQSVEGFFARVANAYGQDVDRLAQGMLAGTLKDESNAIGFLLEKGVMPAESAEYSLFGGGNTNFAIAGRIMQSREAEYGDKFKESKRSMTAGERKLLEDSRKQLEGMRLFIMDSQTAGIKVRRDLDQKWSGFWDAIGDTTVGMVGSVPTMSMAALPYGAGLPVVVNSYYEQSLSNLRRAAPDASEESLQPWALASAVTQAAVDRVQISLLGAKAKNLQAAMFKWGKPGVFTDAAVRVAGVTAAESGTEVAQDLTDPFMQDVASALRKDVPGVEWGPIIEREKEALGDIVAVSAGFALIFGVGGSVTDYMDAKQVGTLLNDRKALEVAGIAPETAKEISQLSQSNPAAAAKALQAAAANTPVEQRRANSEAARAKQEAEKVDPASAGLPVLEKLDDGRVQIAYPDRPAEIVEGNEAALEAMRHWSDDNSVSVTKAIREQIDFLSGRIAETTGGELQLEAEQDAMMPTLGEIAGDSKAKTEMAKQRVQIAMRQAGNDMGLDDIDLNTIPLLGTSQNSFEDGVTTIAAKIGRGANPLTVIEEASEGVAKWLLSSASVGEGKMVGWIRDTEQRTKQQILSPEFASMSPEAKGQEIVEAWSYLAQANATGKVADSALPGAVKAFFRAFKEFIANALRIASEFTKVRGELDPEFTYWLDVSAGVNKETQAERFENEVNMELAADLGQTFGIKLPGDALSKAINDQIRPPEEKAKTFKRMSRLVSQIRARKPADDDRSRFEQVRDIATMEAVVKALPTSVRGSIPANFRKLADLRTPEARQNYILSLLPKVEAALENALQKQFRDAIRKTLKKGEVKVSDAKTRGGKISPHGHDVFAMAKAAMTFDQSKAEAESERITSEIEGSESISPDKLDELDAMRAAVELFHDYENADAARLDQALEFLTETYQKGREEWLSVLAGRKELKTSRIDLIRQGLGVTNVRRSDIPQKAAESKGLAALNESVMAAAFSGSQTIRRLAELTDNAAVKGVVNEMEQAFADAESLESDLNAADQQAFKLALREIFGVSTEYATAKRLRELSDVSKDAPVSTVEGRKTETITVPVNYAEALVEGEISGFERGNGTREELDADDIAALSEEWSKFQDLTEKEQARKRVIGFERTSAKGERLGIGKWSQLEGLQLWLTMRQPDQAKKLEKMGYDQQTMDELDRWLPEDVKQLGEWMVAKIGENTFTIDQLHRLEKGVGLKLVDQYFPVKNRVTAADNSGLSLDGSPQQTGRSVGFIKERVSNTAEPAQVNAVSVFLGHRAQSNFWQSHVTPIREWGGIVKDQRFADAVEAKLGAKYYSALSTLMKRIESGGRLAAKQADDFDRLMKGLTRRFALGTLGLRMSTLIVNTTAALNALYKVPAPKLIRGMMEAMKRPESFKDAWNSPAIKRRIRDGSSFEAILAGQKGPTTRPLVALMESIAQKGVKPINYVDTAANLLGAVSVWEYTRLESERSGMSTEEAKAAADRAVDTLLRQAAQPTSRLSRSEYELATAENPARGLISLFISEPRKNFAITYQAIRELATSRGTEGKALAAQQAAVGLVLMAATENIARSFYQAWANAKDDEEDEVWERFTTRITDPKAWGYKLSTQYLQNIPLFGEGWNQFMGWTWGQKTFDNQNPVNRAASSVLPLAKELMDDDPATIEDVIEGGIKAAQGVGSTVPGGPLVSQIANAADFLEGVVETEEERLDRYKGRYRKFSKELTESIGTDEAENGNKEKKDRLKADWLESNLTPIPAEERKKVLEHVSPSEDVEKLMRR
jgi:hypothetical protein